MYSRLFLLILFVLCVPLSQAQDETLTPQPTAGLVWVCGNDGFIPPVGCPLFAEGHPELSVSYLRSCGECIPDFSCGWKYVDPNPSPTPPSPPAPSNCGDALVSMPVQAETRYQCAPVRNGSYFDSCDYSISGGRWASRLDVFVEFSQSDLQTVSGLGLTWLGDTSVDPVFRVYTCSDGVVSSATCYSPEDWLSSVTSEMTFNYVWKIELHFPSVIFDEQPTSPTWTLTNLFMCVSEEIFQPSHCGQAIGLGWSSSTIGCQGSQTYYYTYWEDGAWRNCAFRSASRRMIALRVAYAIGEAGYDLHTISDFSISWQGDQSYGFDIVFARCHNGDPGLCQSSANLTYTRSSKADLIANPIPTVEHVYNIAIRFHAVDVGAISETTAEGVRNMIVLDDIYFCSSQAIFSPPTPQPSPSPTPTLQPEPCGFPSFTADFWDGVADQGCESSSEWNSFIDPSLQSTLASGQTEFDCDGAYIVDDFSNNNPARLSLEGGRYITSFQADFLCVDGLRYTVVVAGDNGSFPVHSYFCKPSSSTLPNWQRYTLLIPQYDTDQQDYHLTVVSRFSTEPVAPMLPAVDNLQVLYSDRLPCDGGVNDCSVPEYVHDLPPFVGWQGMELTWFDCYDLIPEISFLSIPRIEVCVDFYSMPKMSLLGIEIDFARLLEGVVFWTLLYFIVRSIGGN